MLDYVALPLGDKAPEVVNVVVEIPLQSINKYEYDKKLHVFRLDRNLYSPVHFPGDYGFLPSTLSHDGDPLDVLVLVDSPSFTGCVMEVRPIGVLDMLDQGVHDALVAHAELLEEVAHVAARARAALRRDIRPRRRERRGSQKLHVVCGYGRWRLRTSGKVLWSRKDRNQSAASRRPRLRRQSGRASRRARSRL